MRLHIALLSGFIITFIGIEALYAEECPRLTLDDFVQEKINIPANSELEIQNSFKVYLIKKSVLEQYQMEIPTELEDYPALSARRTDVHSNINLAQVEWNSETKQITCHYEIAEVNSSDFNAFDLTTVRKDIPAPTEYLSSVDHDSPDKFVWKFTHFKNGHGAYDGYSCDGYESPIPASTCVWQDK